MAKTPQVRQEDVEAIAERLRLLRLALGKSQAEMCRALNLSPGAWNNFERAVGRIRVDTAIQLVHAHRVTLDWIYVGDRSGMPSALMEKIDEKRREAA